MTESFVWKIDGADKHFKTYMLRDTRTQFEFCRAFFFVFLGRIEELRIWNKDQDHFVPIGERWDFYGKSVDEVKAYAETLCRLEGLI